MKNKKLVSILLCVCIVLCVTASAVIFNHYNSFEPIVILYENDVHCEVSGYSKLAAMKNELLNTYKHVGVVSCGDFVQGGTLGAVSKGEYIIKIMNKVGYDAIALGNHEFDYQLARLNELNELSNTRFLSCNFTRINDDSTYFDPYVIVSYGRTDVAYVGITTPDTITSTNPSQFMNEDGEVIYTFNNDRLYEVIQNNIDAAKSAGADYVIALSHVGYSESGDIDDVTDIIENTDGFDAVLDAHSHSVIEEITVKDKSGDDVILSSTGTKFEHIGKLTITKDGLDTQLIKTQSYEKTDPLTYALIESINNDYSQLGNRKIGETAIDLNTHDENGDRIVRNAETNLGNLCSDALRIVTGTDISFVNGGGLRSMIKAGDISFNDIFSVFPFNNQVVTAEITGQILLDMLETGMMNYPNEDGSFPHASGVTFSVNSNIDSSVKLDENGFFTSVDGDYRVYNVKILDNTTGEYLPLELDGKYIISGFNYFILDYGGGMSMFKDARIIDAEGVLDVEVLERYIVDYLDGVIGNEYSTPQGRITFTDGYSDR